MQGWHGGRRDVASSTGDSPGVKCRSKAELRYVSGSSMPSMPKSWIGRDSTSSGRRSAVRTSCGSRGPDHDAVGPHLDDDHRLAGIDRQALAHRVDQLAVDEHRAAGQHLRLGHAHAAHQRTARLVGLHVVLAGQARRETPCPSASWAST